MVSKSSTVRKSLILLIIPAVIGIIVSFCFYIAEGIEYSSYCEEYYNHEHTGSCDKIICVKDEHTHSSLCYDCGLSGRYWHTHRDSCYCSKPEHTHDDSCYTKDCVYSSYSSADSYADAFTSFVVPNCILVLSAILISINYWLTNNKSRTAERIHRNISCDSENFFNEKSIIWLSKLKNWIKIIFYFEVIGFIVFGIADAINELTVLGENLEYYVFFVWAFAGVIFAFLTKTVNMLALQFLNNINTIREKVEISSAKETVNEVEKNEEESEETENTQSEESNE